LKPIKDDGGKIVFLIPEGRDITEYRKSDEELRKKMRDLERFQKVTVDRELKMKELKARIAEIETKLNTRT